jgi:hypothetical protein
MPHTFLKNAPEGRHGVRQLAAAFACLPDISCIFKGASKLAHSKSFVFDKKYAALGETPALPVVNRWTAAGNGSRREKYYVA